MQLGCFTLDGSTFEEWKSKQCPIYVLGYPFKIDKGLQDINDLISRDVGHLPLEDDAARLKVIKVLGGHFRSDTGLSSLPELLYKHKRKIVNDMARDPLRDHHLHYAAYVYALTVEHTEPC